MRHLIFAIAILLAAVPALASDAVRVVDLGTLIDAKPLNGAAATRTAYIGPDIAGTGNKKDALAGFTYLGLDLDYTYATTGTVTITVTGGRTAATATAAVGICVVSSGVCTSDAGGVIEIAVTGSVHRVHRLKIRAIPVLKIVVSHNSPAAGDIVTLTAYLTD